MDDWLKPALDYVPRWLEYQLRDTEQPGCVIAVLSKAKWSSNGRSAMLISASGSR
jgi:hypothetical protein